MGNIPDMSKWSPPSLPHKWVIVISFLYIFQVAYGLMITGTVVLNAVIGGVFFASVYFLWRFLVAIEAIAEALQQIGQRSENSEESMFQ